MSIQEVSPSALQAAEAHVIRMVDEAVLIINQRRTQPDDTVLFNMKQNIMKYVRESLTSCLRLWTMARGESYAITYASLLEDRIRHADMSNGRVPDTPSEKTRMNDAVAMALQAALEMDRNPNYGNSARFKYLYHAARIVTRECMNSEPPKTREQANQYMSRARVACANHLRDRTVASYQEASRQISIAHMVIGSFEFEETIVCLDNARAKEGDRFSTLARRILTVFANIIQDKQPLSISFNM
jgi:hypothetical protein